MPPLTTVPERNALSRKTPPSRILLAGLLLTVVCDSLAQLIWKQAASALPDSDDPRVLLLAVLPVPTFWGLAALLLGQLLLWLAVLKRAELSYAQPMTSLSYVGVALLSWLWFGEALTLRSGLGIALILGGVLLMSSEA